jgi:type VI secretion system (T6SS) immunity protein Tdi1
MSLSIHDYLIDQSGIDWRRALSTWSWLLPPEFTVWAVSRIADIFLILPDGTIHMLDIGQGTLIKVAKSRDDFCVLIDHGNNAKDWLAIPIVDRLVAAEIRLEPGQCYAFKKLPILGGDYTVENFAPLSVEDYLGAFGSVHEQLRDLPDGTQVVLKVI